jgi:DNA-directed RNA polymerase subunit beta'
MAVHLPLSAEAQAEARILMRSSNNILSPANGRPITVPTQDMVFGIYYLSLLEENSAGTGRVFRHLHEAERAYEAGELSLHALIEVREPDFPTLLGEDGIWTKTTFGRLLINQALPADFGYINEVIGKRRLPIGSIVQTLASNYPKAVVADSLDKIKNLGFRFGAQSGLTISIDDVRTPANKQAILERHEKDADKAETQYKRGILTDDERRNKEVEIWSLAKADIQREMEQSLRDNPLNPINMMVDSGARGNIDQIRQIAGIKGQVANPQGEIIPRPIKSSFREGLSVLEYFISTHGARKGLADTALRTADSGYLTRRLHDVAQELIIREEDCGTSRGVWVDGVVPDDAKSASYLDTRLYGRVLAEPAGGFEAGYELGDADVDTLRNDAAVTRVRVRSVLTCESDQGVCAQCYGMSLATGRHIELGEAVGTIAAQSIGEPGTQLTMRTFHGGGVAGADITHGLPRVVELFEARTPKGAAPLARISGVVRIEEEENARRITVVGNDAEDAVTVPARARVLVADGQEVTPGEPLTEGPQDPKQLLEIKGIRETQQYLVEEVQQVYRTQGVSVHDKHIELIVRQMLRRVSVADPGDADFLPGERVDAKRYADVNRGLVTENRRPAEGRPELMGITKASLATDSWLSAASFQETTRVLTEAAIEGKSDHLLGLKENIIIGKLIPAGTGMLSYRDIDLDAPEAQPMEFWSSDESEDDIAAWLATRGDGASFEPDESWGGAGTAVSSEYGSAEFGSEEPA